MHQGEEELSRAAVQVSVRNSAMMMTVAMAVGSPAAAAGLTLTKGAIAEPGVPLGDINVRIRLCDVLFEGPDLRRERQQNGNTERAMCLSGGRDGHCFGSDVANASRHREVKKERMTVSRTSVGDAKNEKAVSRTSAGGTKGEAVSWTRADDARSCEIAASRTRAGDARNCWMTALLTRVGNVRKYESSHVCAT